MNKKQKDRYNVESSTELSTPMDVISNTDVTGAVPRPPLTDAEAEGYGDIVPMPQQRADHAGKQQLKKGKRGEHL